ncbi:sensor domain-containing diguanylate cyclase [Actimicrobium antarcticum]|uniref:Sensor domain-containing diguanylate cyclase n=1 Tax=Actimicrobium antarcticum TaxID=1051899 RepID=A0ABP7TZE9_9BURK
MITEQRCPIPENETARLAAVHSHHILDTEPEIEFDALTRVVAHAFDVPIAVIAMMDTDRLWFKSKVGLDVPQLDRKVAFCAHAIVAPKSALVIPDLQDDIRFADNPLVTNAPHLRFYAGVPLVDTTGHALGTIAIIDVQPRVLNHAEQASLLDCATLVMTALQGRLRASVLEQMAMTDYLTALPNRAQFDNALSGAMSRAMRSGVPFSVLCLDLNGFKNVNDRFGHAAGDEVLCEVARRLSGQLRQGDTLARLGGDEFAIVTQEGDHGAVAVLAQRLVASVGQPIMLSSGDTIHVGISVGIAPYRAGITSTLFLLDQADKALYDTKHQNAKLV